MLPNMYVWKMPSKEWQLWVEAHWWLRWIYVRHIELYWYTHWTRICWHGKLFVDAALPFGLWSAPKIFTAVADAVTWVLQQQGVKFIIHYLDGFLLIGPPRCDDCAVALEILLQMFDLLGLPVAWENLEGPMACLTFLGFEIDSLALELRLPKEKMLELQQTVTSWLGRTDCRKKELESLQGQLAYVSKVVKPGKTFIRRLIELLAGFCKP